MRRRSPATSLYLAAWEEWGEEAWTIVWRSGQVLFDEIESELDLDNTTWVEGLQRLADYLARVGYVREITAQQVREDRVEYDMFDPAILPGARRFVAMGAVPAHVSTTLMFALLAKRYGLRAEMIGDPELRDDGHAIEQWHVFPTEEE